MARARYEYGTNPRKLQEQEEFKNKKQKLKIVEDVPRQSIKLSGEQKKKRMKLTISVVALFILLLTISYRSSQINKKFSEVQTLKNNLATLQKENEQLEVSIQNGLNLNTIEKLAKEKLGMQKLTNKQTEYVTLPKKDYTESGSEEIIMDEEESWFDKLLDKLLGV